MQIAPTTIGGSPNLYPSLTMSEVASIRWVQFNSAWWRRGLCPRSPQQAVASGSVQYLHWRGALHGLPEYTRIVRQMWRDCWAFSDGPIAAGGAPPSVPSGLSSAASSFLG